MINEVYKASGMPNHNKALLFIPDITGFTDFVNKTEIEHSKHIITELLEIVINSDNLKMTVSEIEGDAVLFFMKEAPNLDLLINQCEKTFINFHNHLKRYDTERICRCGACETASTLSLKFILHKGTVEIISIKDHQKLHGSDVILAHRLLKNTVPEKEYILATDSFIEDQGWKQIENDTGINAQYRSEVYDNQGDTEYMYIPLKKLLADIGTPAPIDFPRLKNHKISLRHVIEAPLDHIYENFTNFDKRMEWNDEILESVMHGNNLNRTGSLHTCLINSGSLDINTLGRKESGNRVIYGERINDFRGLKDIISIYTFEKQGDKTMVLAEVDYTIKSPLKRLLRPFIHRVLLKQTIKGFNKLKTASEKAIT